MSFLVDAPLLVGAGAAAGVLSEDPKARAVLGAATLGGFYAVSVSMYLEARWTRPIWKLVGARSGRDWMVNSGVFDFDVSRMTRRHHALAALLFASYVGWYLLGLVLGSRLRRRLERNRSSRRYGGPEGDIE